MKKTWIKILFVVIALVIFVFTALHLFIIFQGKSLIVSQIAKVTGKKVALADLSIEPPLTLNIRDLNIEGVAKISRISFSPSIIFLLSGRVGVNKITLIKPEFTFEKNIPETNETAAGEQTLGLQAPTATSLPAAMPSVVPPSIKKGKPSPLVLKHLVVKEGKINFVDHTVGQEGIRITAEDISFDLTDLYLIPSSAITKFKLSGSLPWKEGQEKGAISAEGWLNFYKRDMEASIKIEKIDGIYLHPYYSNWVDLEKARIESAKLNFSSTIHGLNNNITADCHLELTDIVRRPKEPQEGEERAERIADAVLDIFRALNQGKIVLDFTIRTKMDRPEFGFGNIKMAFEERLAYARSKNGFKAQDILSVPAGLVQGAFKGLTDLTTAVIGGTINAGKEIVDTVEGALKGKKEKAPEQEKK